MAHVDDRLVVKLELIALECLAEIDLDLSPLVAFTSWPELRELRERARERGIEGLVLKRADSLYVSGRPKGPWFKWKRGALTLDTVLMYAQRGHGKRSSFYSDYTFGAWRGDELVPVGKAYSGFTDEELRRLDQWVRNNTVRRWGPVREVSPQIVLEVAFDSVHRSTRHKSGAAMRFPRRLQELCGYSVYKGQFGHIDNHDPIELLGRERGKRMVWEATDAKKPRMAGQ